MLKMQTGVTGRLLASVCIGITWHGRIWRPTPINLCVKVLVSREPAELVIFEETTKARVN